MFEVEQERKKEGSDSGSARARRSSSIIAANITTHITHHPHYENYSTTVPKSTTLNPSTSQIPLSGLRRRAPSHPYREACPSTQTPTPTTGANTQRRLLSLILCIPFIPFSQVLPIRAPTRREIVKAAPVRSGGAVGACAAVDRRGWRGSRAWIAVEEGLEARGRAGEGGWGGGRR